MIFFLCLLAAFLLGSVPFGLLVGKIWLGIDVRKEGSGNFGMTNVMRIGGRGPGIVTFLLDFGKGFLAVRLASLDAVLLNEDDERRMVMLTLVGCAAVLGHVYSVFLKFKGGKGVSTLFGILAALSLGIGLLAGAVWISMFLWKRVSSLSALTLLVVLPWLFLLISWLTEQTPSLKQFFRIFALSVLLIYKHRENISRLISGEEGKLKT